MSEYQAQKALAEYVSIKARLRAEFPDLAEDETALLDTLEGVTDLREAIIAIMRSRDDDAILIEGIQARIDELQDRGSRFSDRATKKKTFVAAIMERAEIKKIEAPDFTLSLGKKARQLVVSDESAIPPEYWTEKVVRSLDKKALKDHLAVEMTIPGASLDNGGVQLTVRTK